MHYQIFISGNGLAGAASVLSARGLGDLASPSPTSITLPQGPSGSAGMLLAWGKSPEENSYQPDQQTWKQIDRDVWYGIWTDSPPTPEDLQRPQVGLKYSLPLGDGQRWNLPAAARLPRTMRFAGGKWSRGERLAAHQKLWELSEVWYKRINGIDGESMPVEDGETAETIDQQWMEFLTTALCLNYHVCPLIVSEMGLLTTANRLSVTLAILDAMEIEETQKDLAKNSDAPAPATS